MDVLIQLEVEVVRSEVVVGSYPNESVSVAQMGFCR